MIGQLDKDIIDRFRNEFENNCIQLLQESYAELVSSGVILKDHSENSVSLVLKNYMTKNPKSSFYKIDITREYYLDDEDDVTGSTNPDESPRIDFRFSNWTSLIKVEYFIEAKNLAESNWQKASTGAKVDAAKLLKRYINTGIGNFISGKYPNGCLVGYVMEGDIEKIVQKINFLLDELKRTNEMLEKIKFLSIEHVYSSKHANSTISVLKHFLLNIN